MANTQIQTALIGEILIRKKFVSATEVEYALTEQSKSRRKLGEILVERSLISQANLNQVLEEQHVLLGQLLIQSKVISQTQLASTLIWQRCRNQKLGELLVEKGLISQEQLEKLLEKQYWQKNGFWLIS